jgi:glucosamine kinase
MQSSAFPNTLRQVLNDVDAAHVGAFGGKPGILILSGTGSMAWARNATGCRHVPAAGAI